MRSTPALSPEREDCSTVRVNHHPHDRRLRGSLVRVGTAGVPLGEAARRLGHSVEVLVSTYVRAPTGDEAVANRIIDSVLALEADDPVNR